MQWAAENIKRERKITPKETNQPACQQNNKLTDWLTDLMEQSLFWKASSQSDRNSSPFKKPEVSLLCSQEPVQGPV